MNDLGKYTKNGIAAVLAFALLFLLGAIPGLPSTINRISDQLLTHDQITTKSLNIQRLICRGVWKANPEMQELFDKNY